MADSTSSTVQSIVHNPPVAAIENHSLSPTEGSGTSVAFACELIEREFQSEIADGTRPECFDRTFGSVPFVEVRQSLPSKVAIISPFVDQVMGFIARFRKVDGSEFEIELAVREALANAVVHGNHEDPHRHVYVVCRCSPDGEVSIAIQDEGQGFDNRAAADPTAPENRLLAHGRGVYLMRTVNG